ncbi:MAG TPA: hypothetical protein VFN67_42230 [Polyangiales bacterium]|nr:hypothetical protein [Polyangiales bacterium]
MHAPRTPTLLERVRFWSGRSRPYLGLVLLNCWLFVPRFFTAEAHWLPFTPEADSVLQYPLQLFGRRDNLDVFRFSIDLAVAVLVLIWTARTPAKRALRVLCTTLYVVLWVFLIYHHAVAHFYERKPALLEDIRLSLNLWHFIEGYAHYGFLVIAGLVLYLALLSWLVTRSFAALQLRAASWSQRRKLRVSAALALPAALSLIVYGARRDQPFFQVTTRAVTANFRASVREAKRMAQLRSAPPDLRYEAFSQIHLKRKPDVYLVMVEAYGEILSTWDMNAAYTALMQRVEERLGHAGYHTASTYSTSPVHGGTSWFSISTVHTGIQIDRPQTYDALQRVGARIPSITRFFREQGYLTHSLQPGVQLHSGLNRFDLFNHEVPVDAATLAYQGPEYGWGVIPDQYSIGVFRERFFRPTDQPRYAFFMGVSTHYIWENTPPYVRNWKSLQEAEPARQDYDDSWAPLHPKLLRRIRTDLRRDYFRSIIYEWRLLTEWFEAEAKRGNVILVVGDHQPRLEWDVPGGVTMNTPVHVISQDAALIERFKARGFQDGMYALPHQGPTLQHAGLLSLFLTELSEAYAEEGSVKATYYPQGLPLAGLNR